MRGLLLVDADSVASSGGTTPKLESCAKELASRSLELGEITEWCAVIGMNLHTAASWALRDPIVEARAVVERLVRGATAKPVELELILSLNAPETTDSALFRAKTVAASASTAGAFDRLVMVSEDRWLHFTANKGELHSLKKSSGAHLTSVFSGRCNRRPPRATRPGIAELPTTQTWDWPSICTQHDASSAANFPLPRWLDDGSHSQQIRAFIAQIAEYPAALSWVGPTSTTHRGVSRWMALLAEETPTFACHEQDGLDLWVHRPFEEPLLKDTECEPASVETGAIVLRGKSSSFRRVLPCLLPNAVVSDLMRRIDSTHLAIPIPAGGDGLTSTLLQLGVDVLPDVPIGATAKVRFRTSGETLVTEVMRTSADPLAAWWARSKGSTVSASSKAKRIVGVIVERSHVEVDARGVFVRDADGALWLALCAAETSTATLYPKVGNAILRRHEIVEAGADKGQVVAYLMTESLPLEAICKVDVIPIHVADPSKLQRTGLSREQTNVLRTLPLLVDARLA